MPAGVEDDPEDLVFLSPEELPPPKVPVNDQGASPVLRRSNRKRKSVASVGEMTKPAGSRSKKKKASPGKPEQDAGKSMPRIPRTPLGTAEPAQSQPQP